MLCFLIYITLPFIQLVYFISSEKKLTIHIVQMFHLLSQVFYNLKKFLMMDMLGVGDAININTNKNIRQVGNDSNLLIVFYVQIMPDDFVMQLHRF